MSRKLCIIVGAGCTVADCSQIPKRRRPPLDKEFFSYAKFSYPGLVSKIQAYLKKVYDVGLLDTENDSLEKAMAMIYTDIFDPSLKNEASVVFRALISLFNRRLADTTNHLPATRGRYLYRIITHYLNDGVKPSDIDIVTFNQDIQIEKVLEVIEKAQCYRRLGVIFNFPFCYSINMDKAVITYPTEERVNIFKEGDEHGVGIMVLKLHGSLNWYSTHLSSEIRPSSMFRPDRKLYISARDRIYTALRHKGRRRLYTFPIIIPPVTQKSSILHNSIRPLWNQAGKALKAAEEILVFGYSCPAMDFESSNLIQRSLRGTLPLRTISIIDPEPRVLKRYVDLIEPSQITYYPSARAFLQKKTQ